MRSGKEQELKALMAFGKGERGVTGMNFLRRCLQRNKTGSRYRGAPKKKKKYCIHKPGAKVFYIPVQPSTSKGPKISATTSAGLTFGLGANTGGGADGRNKGEGTKKK